MGMALGFAGVMMFLGSGAAEASPVSGVDVRGSQNPLDSLPQFSVVPEMPDQIEVRSEGVMEYDSEGKTLLYRAEEDPLIRVKTDKGLELYAKSAMFHFEERYVDLEGAVSIYQGASVSRADSARYYWDKDKEELETHNLKTKVNGFILESGRFVVKTNSEGRSYYEGKNAGVTLQDIDKPDSWLRGGRIRLYPEDSVEFKHMKVYVGDIPIFYFPYFSHSLNPKLGYLPIVGSRSTWGPFIKNEYGIVIGDKYVEKGIPTGDLIGVFHLDYRVRRGVAFGFDMERPKMRKEYTDFKGLSLYYASDEGTNILLEGIPRIPISSDRWMMRYQERFASRKKDNSWWWRLDVNTTVLSDAYMLEDFMPNMVQDEQQPDNTVAVVGVKDEHVVTALFRAAPNDHYYTDERYPEISWDRVRGPLLNSAVQYEGSASFGILSQYVPNAKQRYASYNIRRLSPKDPRYSTLSEDAMTDAYGRFHTYHELERPFQAGEFTFTPKVGGGYTGYCGVDGIEMQDRGLFYAGMGVRTRFTGEFSGVKNDFLGLDGLRHVIEPYSEYSFVSTNEIDSSIPKLDDWTLTTNPTSLSVGRFSAVDSIASWNTVRMGIRNIFVTNREDASHQWLTWDVFVDGYLNDPELDRRFSNMCSYINWAPKPWMTVYLRNQFPVIDSGSGYQEHVIGTTFMPCRYLEFVIRNQNLINHPMIRDSNLLNTQVNIHVSNKSSLSARFCWEIDDSTLERQEYMYYRNLGSWVLGLGVYSYYNRIQRDTGIMMTFSLKEFPSTRFPFKF